MYRFKHVTGNFIYCDTRMFLKVGGVKEPCVEKQ